MSAITLLSATVLAALPLQVYRGGPYPGVPRPAPVEDSIRVTVVGTLRTGVVAIGAETTGTTITAKGITWELDFRRNPALQRAAQALDGRKVQVRGSLERRPGVEIAERWIVTVSDLRPMTPARPIGPWSPYQRSPLPR